jgi:hypothetical protein
LDWWNQRKCRGSWKDSVIQKWKLFSVFKFYKVKNYLDVNVSQLIPNT